MNDSCENLSLSLAIEHRLRTICGDRFANCRGEILSCPDEFWKEVRQYMIQCVDIDHESIDSFFDEYIYADKSLFEIDKGLALIQQRVEDQYS